MILEWSAIASTDVASETKIPSEGKSQPIGQSPCHKPDTFGEPYPPQCLFIWSGAGCEIYGNEEDDADWKGER